MLALLVNTQRAMSIGGCRAFKKSVHLKRQSEFKVHSKIEIANFVDRSVLC